MIVRLVVLQFFNGGIDAGLLGFGQLVITIAENHGDLACITLTLAPFILNGSGHLALHVGRDRGVAVIAHQSGDVGHADHRG